MVVYIFIIAIIALCLGYRFYGSYATKMIQIDDKNITPAHTMNDNIDYVPAKPVILLGHHFSSIAGAGPVMGPVLAALYFGWLPAVLWIVLGTIFIGGIHDFTTLVASVRHEAKSIPEICRKYINHTTYNIFLIFVWLTLVYIILVFTDITANTFCESPEVATSSMIYIVLALIFGYTINKLRVPLVIATICALVVLFGGLYIGTIYPMDMTSIAGSIGLSLNQFWCLLLFVYCIAASITPVWILLQPRDYLSSYLLYATLLGGTLGIIFGGATIAYPAFIGWKTAEGPLFPILFITIACGACSGFHGIISSGTTAKQLNKETDAKAVGYGSMAIEAVVALLALTTVVILPQSSEILRKPPIQVFAGGMGQLLSKIGISTKYGELFAFLALSTFVLTSLDTGTRLGRYLVQEFFNMKKNALNMFLATMITLIIPIVFTFITLHDANGNPTPSWKAIWPVFGATNQLLAALALFSVLSWLKMSGMKYKYVLFPAIFMIIASFYALGLLFFNNPSYIIKGIAVLLSILAIIVVCQICRIFFVKNQNN